jgi:hypothetical protein
MLAMRNAIENQGFGKNAKLYFANLQSPQVTVFTLRDALDAEQHSSVLRFVFDVS